jgi:hypothetical protein
MSQVGYQNVPTINTAFQNQYRTSVETLLRQEGSLLAPHVTHETIMGAEQLFWNQIGSLVAEPDDVRHDDTTYQEILHLKRAIVPADWKVTILLDQPDQWRTLSDFHGPYSKAVATALQHRMDDTIVQGLLGVNYGGKDGRTVINMPSSQIIPVTYNGAGGTTATPLTVQKTSAAARILNQNQVPLHEKRTLFLNAAQMSAFIEQQAVSDANYNITRGLYEGGVGGYSGFNFVLTERIPKDADGNDQIIAFAKPYALFGQMKALETHVDIMPNKNYAWQVFGRASFAASRTQEKGVVIIKCAPVA